jgi:hypothetical protein
MERSRIAWSSSSTRLEDRSRRVDSVIQILNEAKQTHRLITQVLEGNLCASMCIPIALKAMIVLLHGQATGSSMKPPDREQMARNEQI